MFLNFVYLLPFFISSDKQKIALRKKILQDFIFEHPKNVEIRARLVCSSPFLSALLFLYILIPHNRYHLATMKTCGKLTLEYWWRQNARGI